MYMKQKEAMSYIGVKAYATWRKIALNFPRYTLLGQARYKKEDIDNWMEREMIEKGEEPSDGGA